MEYVKSKLNANNRILELEAIRGIMAILIMLFHYTTRYNELFGHKIPYNINFPYGKFGVQFFLITSGFVMLFSFKENFKIKDFIIKKFFRLYPAYIVSITLIFIILSVYQIEGRSVDFNTYLINLTMLEGFFNVSYVDRAHWYLTVEIIFTFLCALSFKVLSDTKKINIRSLLIGWLTITIVLQVGKEIIPFGKVFRLFFLVQYAPFFIIGVIFYLKKYHNQNNKIILVLSILSIALQGKIQLFFATIFLIVIFKLLIMDKLKFLNNKVLVYIGSISYSLYLIHQNIGYVIIDFMEKKGLTSEWCLIIPCTIAIILAIIINYTIEKPLLRFIKKRFL